MMADTEEQARGKIDLIIQTWEPRLAYQQACLQRPFVWAS